METGNPGTKNPDAHRSVGTRMIHRFLLRCFLLVVACGLSFLPLSAFGETIRLRPGFQHIIEFREARRLSIGNSAIIEARPLPRRDGILVVGKKEGETDLRLWGQGEKQVWMGNGAGEAGAEGEEGRRHAACFPAYASTR